MNTISYSVLQYRHDRALDEAINIGVLAFSPSEQKAAFEYDQHYKQLSALYRDFDSAGFRSCLRRLGVRIGDANFKAIGRSNAFFDDPLRSADQLLKSIWPDQGASLVGSPSKYTVAADVAAEAKSLFDRIVLAARPERAYRGNRKDEDVWEAVTERLRHIEGLAAHFDSQKIDDEVEFDYVAKSGRSSKLIAVEPVAFDYLGDSSVKERTFELVGKAAGLESMDHFGQMFVVIGDVQRNSEVREKVRWAEKYISKNARKTTILEEKNIDDLISALR